MDYSRLFEDFDAPGVPSWEALRERCRSQISAEWLAAIARAGRGLEAGEIVCCAGKLTGAETIAALAGNSEATAVALDDPLVELATPVLGRARPSVDAIGQQIESGGMGDRVWLLEGELQTFLSELREMGSDDRIGLYVDCGRGEYRSLLLRLLAIEPWLSDRAVVFVMEGGVAACQAIADFLKVRGLGIRLEPSCIDPALNSVIGLLLWNRHGEPWPAQVVARSLDFADKTIPRKIVQSQLASSTQMDIVLDNAIDFYHHHGLYDETEQIYLNILDIEPNYIKALQDFGLLQLERKRYSQAVKVLWRAVAVGQEAAPCLVSQLAEAYFGLGLTYTEIGDVPRAVASYKHALDGSPKHFDALINLGKILDDLDRLDDAADLFDRAIAAQPDRAAAYLGRARIWLDAYDFDRAIVCYQTGLDRCIDETDRAELQRGIEIAQNYEADPRSLCRQFASDARAKAQPHRVLRHEHRLYDLDSNPANARSLVASYRALNQNEDALQVATEVLERADGTQEHRVELHHACVQIELECGLADRAHDRAITATREYPDSARLQLQRVLLVPMFHETPEQLERARAKLFAGLDWLGNEIARSLDGDPDAIPPADWLDAFCCHSHVYISYQGKDDRPFQTRYGQLFARLAARAYPQFAADRDKPNRDPNTRLKIGFISSTLGPARLGELTIGWLENLDRQKFSIHGYYTHPRADALTARFRDACDRFEHFSLGAFPQTIADDDLDVLIYTDLGLDAQLFTLAALRLAPVQCTSWAHPVTTGLPTIDYFLSSAAMEPDDGDRHYSEKLVRLSDLGIVFPLPILKKATDDARQQTRQQFGLAGERVLFLCCQSLLKYLPQDDWIWAKIADRVPDSQLVFISHPSPQLTEKFRARLARAFADRGLEFGDRAKILPRLSEADYLRINQCCDVFLDSFRWSGGVTTLKAIACDLPIVTCPGELMRSRHSAGILQTLGVAETIAASPEEYIDLAARLAEDLPWRAELQEKMRDRHGRLYDNAACVRDLEAFFCKVCRD